ncbi:MAG: acylphosphatase [Candidatus Ranarchaeia archaeon]
MASEKVAALIRIYGRVQGVFFRANVYSEAVSRGICGWVRNRLDGSVEGLFQGTRHSVEEVIEYCKHGPPAADVRSIKLTWTKFDPTIKGFKIEATT